ncbi:MAG: histidine--tRNA ligase [Candidatus Nitrosopelagicus sp.]|jgi:histidyl-tRNA synthetase|nr:histidine--tRNA ligase [Candidatus Nitrosopelagicus sp.]MBT4455194.1 histidine--tRNA ligase [Candidatus Nitrosopelagicus sp.]MBT7252746.1 histidine--tRNA ligase [Candidatus Nitrosopelagicus sp.]|tara:strand:- start:4807 stop:6078 length:1272 start_codon:yes stop_codon:yes gene_type:complete
MDLPRGMKDFENSEIQKIEYIREKFLSTSEIFGFELMEPSSIELMSVIEAKSGPAIRDDVYFFNDKGDREVSLRFDFTVGLTRYVTGQKSMKLPAKISAFGGVWRYDEPQKGRYRFFHQWDIEIFGKQNTETDAEIIEFTSKFFSNLGLENTILSISHRKIVQSYISSVFESDKPELISDILRAIDKIQKKSKQEIFSEYEKKGYAKEKLEKIIEFSKLKGSPEEISKILDVTQFENWSELIILFESLKNRNVNNIQIDFGIVRGLDYYSGVVFEAFDKTFDIGALVGGGRYDNLPSVFGRDDLGATGVAGGVERIILALENQKSSFTEQKNRVSILYVNEEMKSIAIKITSLLRENSIPTDIDLSGRALKKQMEHSTNSKFVIIVGPDEYSKNMVVVRNMSDRKENQVLIPELLKHIKNLLM